MLSIFSQSLYFIVSGTWPVKEALVPGDGSSAVKSPNSAHDFVIGANTHLHLG